MTGEAEERVAGREGELVRRGREQDVGQRGYCLDGCQFWSGGEVGGLREYVVELLLCGRIVDVAAGIEVCCRTGVAVWVMW